MNEINRVMLSSNYRQVTVKEELVKVFLTDLIMHLEHHRGSVFKLIMYVYGTLSQSLNVSLVTKETWLTH